MRPVESRTETATRTPSDAITEAEKKYEVRFLLDSKAILHSAQIRAYRHKVCVTPIHILLAVSTSTYWGGLLSRAELNWRLLDHHAFSDERIDPKSHLQTPITDGFEEVVGQAAKNTKDSNCVYVQPRDILIAALSHKDIINALSQDEGAIDRIENEMDLIDGQQQLKGIVQLLTNNNPSREYRMDLLAKLREAAGLQE